VQTLGLLLVVLDDFGRAYAGLAGVAPSVAKRLALARQVPALARVHFDLVEVRAIAFVERVALVEAMFIATSRSIRFSQNWVHRGSNWDYRPGEVRSVTLGFDIGWGNRVGDRVAG